MPERLRFGTLLHVIRYNPLSQQNTMFWQLIYNTLILPALRLAFHFAGCCNQKVREGLTGRRQVFEKLTHQLQSARKLEKTAWFHFASVGEFEQVKPLIESIYADTRIVLTFFSPSVAPNVHTYLHVDAVVYLPFDTRRNVQRLINLIAPTCLIFSRYDIWPNLVWCAAKDDIPVIVVAGTVQAGSKRLGGIARSFFRSVHPYITLHCAVSDADATRFQFLGAPAHQVVVTGDPRYEQVYRRAIDVDPNAEFFPGHKTLKHPILIAGSTYTADERVLLKTFQILRQEVREQTPQLILVPHEPTPERITEIRTKLEQQNWEYRCFSELKTDVNLAEIDVIIVDTVGILAKLYRLADIAFVGGSFHGSVHNVMEPAAMGIPVLFGPTIRNASEALLLQERNAAKVVQTPEQMAAALTEWLADETARITAGHIGKQMVLENLGAVAQTLRHLREYLTV